MKAKRIGTLLLVLSLLVSGVSGCSSKNTDKDTNNTLNPTQAAENNDANKGEQTSSGDVTTAPEVTWPDNTSISWYIRGGAADFNNYLYADLKGIHAIEDATDIDIEFQVVNAPSNQEIDAQYLLMLAGGTYPDVIQYLHNESYPGGVPKLHEEGVAIELNSLIENYMPNLQKILKENPEIARDMKNDEGKFLYFSKLNSFSKPEDVLDVSYWGFLMRKDWLENVGLNYPENIDDWYKVLSAFKTQDPNGNGQQDEIPFDAGAGAASMFMTAYGVMSGVYIDQKTGKVAYGEATPEYKEYLETMNKWYSEGLIANIFDETGNAVPGSVTDENIYADIAGSWKGLANNWEQRLPKVLEKNPNADLVAVPWLTSTDGEKYTPNRYFSHIGREQIIITPDCEYPEAVATIIDYMYSPEGSANLTWGVEGETYSTNADGTRVLTDYANEVIDYYDGNFPRIFSYAMSHVGFPRFDFNDFSASSREQQYVDACNLWAYASRALVYPPSIVLTSAEQEAAIGTTTDLGQYIAEMQMKFITGEEPLTNYDNYISTLEKMGINKLVEAYQGAYDRYLAR